MLNKCPGSATNKSLDSTIVKCASCGVDVELFSDEPKRRCHCGNIVRRDTTPRCADWCPAAAQCLGEAADARSFEKRRDEIRSNPVAKECLARIAALIEKKKSG
ncbi:MAG: hypothetical protein QGH60_15370 [Phycisphaerae bacterium]|jgi:hypothetical protein|nr:hypothetical protein [Phycisphaerae bacterium]